MASIRERDRLLRLLRSEVAKLGARRSLPGESEASTTPEEELLEKVAAEFGKSADKLLARLATKHGLTLGRRRHDDRGRYLVSDALISKGSSLGVAASNARHRAAGAIRKKRDKAFYAATALLDDFERQCILEGLTEELRGEAKALLEKIHKLFE